MIKKPQKPKIIQIQKKNQKPTITKNKPKVITSKPSIVASQPQKIVIENNNQETNLFHKILKPTIKIGIYLLPLIIILGLFWLVMTQFFPTVLANISDAFGKGFNNIKNGVHDINNKIKEVFKNMGCSEKTASLCSFLTPIILLSTLAFACCYIPVVGPLITTGIVIGTVIYCGFSLMTTPSNPPSPKKMPDVVVTENKNTETGKTQVAKETGKKPIPTE